MNNLHNRLMMAFEAATHGTLREDYARREAEDLHNLLAEWTSVLENALQGDKEQTKEALERAFLTAMKSDKGRPPSSQDEVPIVRYGDLQ